MSDITRPKLTEADRKVLAFALSSMRDDRDRRRDADNTDWEKRWEAAEDLFRRILGKSYTPHSPSAPPAVKVGPTYIDGIGVAVKRIQAYATELFLHGGHYDEVPAERLRDMANELLLDAGKHLQETREKEGVK